MTACAQPMSQTHDVPNADFLNLIVRCYDALLRDLQEAKSAHAAGDENLLMDRLRHAQDLVTELLLGLDYERGGEIAVNLGRLYNYMLRELIGLRDTDAQETLTQMLTMTANLREAWVQVAGCA